MADGAASAGMLCDLALDLGVERSVSVVLVVFNDVTKLGLRDLFIEKKVGCPNDADHSGPSLLLPRPVIPFRHPICPDNFEAPPVQAAMACAFSRVSSVVNGEGTGQGKKGGGNARYQLSEGRPDALAGSLRARALLTTSPRGSKRLVIVPPGGTHGRPRVDGRHSWEAQS